MDKFNFNQKKHIGLTVWLGDTALIIIELKDNSRSPHVVICKDKSKQTHAFTANGRNSSGLGRLSWVKQEFVMGEPPIPELEPLEFKGVPVLAYVGNEHERVSEARKKWVIGKKHGLFISLNSGHECFLTSMMNQDKNETTYFNESRYAWEVPKDE